jgi:hypothetical protein
MRKNLPSLGMLSEWSLHIKVIRDSDQYRYFGTIGPMVLTTHPISLSLHWDSWGADQIMIAFSLRKGAIAFHVQSPSDFLPLAKSPWSCSSSSWCIPSA